MTATTYNIFTYGTLMCPSLFKNMTRVTEDQFNKITSEVTKIKGFERRSVLGGSFPAIIHSPGSEVEGILWKGVPKHALQHLDAYEGVPHMYKRNQVSGPDIKSCYVYVWNLGEDRLSQGDWDRAETLIEHHKVQSND